MPRGSLEVLVLGGGPAGCAASRLLAQWGHRVLLVTKPRNETDRLELAESIPPSTRKLFDLLGVTPALDAAGFVRATGNTVWWGADSRRVEYFENGERGWQVTNRALERLLRDAAVAAGVEVAEASYAGDHRDILDTPFILDCTGRAGLLARGRGLRRHDDQLRTVALVGVWQAPEFNIRDDTHTVIESYEGGWAWSVPDAAGRRHVAVMVDPRTSTLARDVEARAVYTHEIGKTRQLAGMVAPAQLIEGPAGWDASMYDALRYVDGNVLLVGDAGSFIDPLSSAGVKKALASAWLAAVAVHTSLVRPEMRETAMDFFAAREAEVYESFRAMTRRFLAAAAAGHADPFWRDRVEDPAPDVDHDLARAAFDRIRAEPVLALAVASDVRLESRPAVSGSEIVLELRLVSSAQPQGVRYAFDVDLVALIQLAPLHHSVPDLFAAYNRLHAPVALPDFLAALSASVGRKWLLWL